MSDNVFNGDSTTTTTTTTAPSNLEDLLKNIKNDDGQPKYKSLEDALIALDHSQKYIPELKNQLTGTNTQLEAMKAEIAKFGNIEETVQRLLAQRQSTAATTPEAKGLDEQAVRKLVEDSLSTQQQAQQAQTNQKQVSDALVSKYGEKAIEVMEAKVAELHITKQVLGDLAKQNPALVLALFNTSAQKEVNPTVGSNRTPPPKTVTNTVGRPEKSILSGATMKDQASYLDKIKAEVWAKHGITS